MADHTPTPWRVEEGTDLIWGACNPDDMSTYGMGYSIVQGKSGSWGDRKPGMDEREANAAFIVKAVNSHDALVKSLQDIVFTAEDDEKWATRPDRMFILKQAQDVLAALKEAGR